jgi:beta-lactamase superfamily II metal-dependent hydrolase
MSSAELLILDVGHGNAALYRDSEVVVVIDGGPDYTLAEYVGHQNIHQISQIFLSHADEDHLRGILLLLEGDPQLTVDAIYVNPAQEKASELWSAFSTEIDRLEADGTVVATALTRSSPGALTAGDSHLEVLSPPPGRVLAENRDNRWSAVLRLSYAGSPIALFCGDADAHALRIMLRDRRELPARILVFPHHGGGLGIQDPTALSTLLLDAVEPELVLFSMGRARYDNPLSTIVESVARHGDHKIACTQLSGRCCRRVFPHRSVHMSSAGRERGISCLGTLLVPLPLDGDLPLSDHKAFVDSLLGMGHTPVCRESTTYQSDLETVADIAGAS